MSKNDTLKKVMPSDKDFKKDSGYNPPPKNIQPPKVPTPPPPPKKKN